MPSRMAGKKEHCISDILIASIRVVWILTVRYVTTMIKIGAINKLAVGYYEDC